MEHRNKPRLLDLFTGTGSVARVAEELGYEVHTLDIDRRCKPDLCVDTAHKEELRIKGGEGGGGGAK